MSHNQLEHINITVSNLDKTADMLQTLFGWKERWRGGSIHKGETIHVGSDDTYIAVYKSPTAPNDQSYSQVAGLNHIAVTVEDLDAAEQRILAAGYATENHGDYEPGRRFYFRDHDNIEYEIVSYADQSANPIPSLSGGIDHIHLYVSDRSEAANWYRDTLGFKPVTAFAHWAEDPKGPLTITDRSNKIHLALFARDERQTVSIAFGATAKEYQAWKQRFTDLDLSPIEKDHGMAHSLYITDPWDNGIEVTTYEMRG